MAYQDRLEPETGRSDGSLGTYWLSHAWLAGFVPGYLAVLVGVVFIGFVSGATGLLTPAEAGQIGEAIGRAYVRLWAIGAFVAYFVAAFGYYVEARRLEELGSDWQPNWIAYLAVHVLLPFLAAPVYLLQRWRHVGVP